MMKSRGINFKMAVEKRPTERARERETEDLSSPREYAVNPLKSQKQPVPN